MLKAAPAVALVLCVVTISLAQERKLNPELPNPNIRERYDRFSDLTSVVLGIPIISGAVDLGGGSVYVAPGSVARDLELAIMGVFAGKDIAKAIPRVRLVFTSRSEEWLFLKSSNLLQAIVDGNTRITIGEMKRVTSEVQPRGRGVIEQLALEVPFATVEKLSRAIKLEMRIGDDEFELKKRQLEDLKDWVNKFPSAKTEVMH